MPKRRWRCNHTGFSSYKDNSELKLKANRTIVYRLGECLISSNEMLLLCLREFVLEKLFMSAKCNPDGLLN